MAELGEKSCLDLEAGPRRCSAARESEGSLYFSDDADDHQPWHFAGSSFDEFRRSGASSDEIDGIEEEEACRSSCISNSSFEVELECGSTEFKVNLEHKERDCRICHLGLVSNAPESGIAIVLGCSCKDDLAAAHKQCAETWFKIRGNKTCEICNSTAKNVVTASESELIEQSNETSTAVAASAQHQHSFWQGHRFLNFLLACMIFAFVISWLFHFNVPG